MTLQAAERAGVFARVSTSRWRQNRLLILCYHGVALADEHEWSDAHIPESRLRQRFEILRSKPCTVLPFREALERLTQGDLPPCSVTVTFDDGLYDFYERALPLIQEYEIPTTLYASTYYSTHRRPIFDPACSYLLWRGRGVLIEPGNLLPRPMRIRVPERASSRTALHLAIRAHMNAAGYSAVEKDAMLTHLAGQVGVDWNAFVGSRMLQLMSPSEFASLDRRLIDVQLHTHRHRTPRDESLFMQELDDNIAALEAMGLPRSGLTQFCYPSGDADPIFYPWLEARGIQSATTCEPRIATRRAHRLDLPRVIDTMAMSDAEFRGWTSGVCALLPRRRFRTDQHELDAFADPDSALWRRIARNGEMTASADPAAGARRAQPALHRR